MKISSPSSFPPTSQVPGIKWDADEQKEADALKAVVTSAYEKITPHWEKHTEMRKKIMNARGCCLGITKVADRANADAERKKFLDKQREILKDLDKESLEKVV